MTMPIYVGLYPLVVMPQMSMMRIGVATGNSRQSTAEKQRHLHSN